ncbi:MAG: hypothetical protein KDA65_17835 [Planctomycetaceae bacterium]|nr:hypothetical protein [Planctomycetaceae bacterium]
MIGSEYASPTDDGQYEHLPTSLQMDETDINLRAYLSRLSDEHLREYQSDWTDEEVIQWDGNFRSDGNLMLVCCERDVDVTEFRRVLKEHLEYRKI